MNSQPPILDQMRTELSDHRLWQTRAVVLAFGALSGLVVVLFTWLTDRALGLFHFLHGLWFWLPLVWTPLLTAFIVWLTRRHVPGAAGSGIPQVMAAVDTQVPPEARSLFVSVKLTLSKMVLTALGLA
ncbi:MAG TPA: chloride channel protein, partial [Aquabacterium sp.]|nr:chloride channel protein [Aquabacterium sp.]